MSKSYKKNPVVKTKGPKKELYWKTTRRKIKQAINKADDLSELELPELKAVIKDGDYIDRISNCIDVDDCMCIKTYGKQRCKNK